MKRLNPDLHGAVPDASASALLILDMFSDFNFDDGLIAARRAAVTAKRIAALKVRACRAGVPALYVNDHLGRWRSDFTALFEYCAASSRGCKIAELLKPEREDYRVLKPKHSAFFASPLESLLQHLGARRLILTGSTAQQCILFTAIDAYVRDYELCIPSDCIVSLSGKEKRFASYFFQTVLESDQRDSQRMRFPQKRSDRSKRT